MQSIYTASCSALSVLISLFYTLKSSLFPHVLISLSYSNRHDSLSVVLLVNHLDNHPSNLRDNQLIVLLVNHHDNLHHNHRLNLLVNHQHNHLVNPLCVQRVNLHVNHLDSLPVTLPSSPLPSSPHLVIPSKSCSSFPSMILSLFV